MNKQDLTLLTDLYELTMMQGYYEQKQNELVVFDVFFRQNPCKNGYSVCAGLAQVIEYIKNLNFTYEDVDYLRSLGIFSESFLDYLSGFHFSGSIYAIPEGTVVFPKEPLLKVIAPIMEAQLVETAILNIINHQSLIATKTSRIVFAAAGDGIMEFGLRRAQGPDAGLYGARAAMIGGCVGTSNVLAGQAFGVPVMGTHAHSWIMSFKDEYTAFKHYANLYPDNCTLLVDTYDTLKSGVPNAIRVFKEFKDAGKSFKKYGIRLDSGDLAYLSKKARKMLDEAGFSDASICASNDLDEYLLHDLKIQGAAIDSYPLLLPQRTVRPSAGFISWRQFKIVTENLFRKLRFPKILKKSLILETRQSSVSMIKKRVKCVQILFVLLMKSMIQVKTFCFSTLLTHGRKQSFPGAPILCEKFLSLCSETANVSINRLLLWKLQNTADMKRTPCGKKQSVSSIPTGYM